MSRQSTDELLAMLDDAHTTSKTGGKSSKSLKTATLKPAQKPQPAVEVKQPLRTRAPSKSKKEEKKEIGSSLRSEQASTAAPSLAVAAQVPTSNLDRPPPQNRMTVKLTTGETVNNQQLFAIASRLPREDVKRILDTVSLKPLRLALLKCFARSLRDTYRLKWCSKYNKRTNAWRDTPRADQQFLRAAEFLAQEYVTRGMTSDQFIEACDEMKPRSLRFVTVDMLAGATGSRVAAWLPPELRERDKPWTSHEDSQGGLWLTPHGEQPVPVIRTAADRDRFLRQIKVR